MRQFAREKILKALSQISINLSSTWLAILLISPGLLGISTSEYLKIILSNLVPAIISLTIGIAMMQNE